MHKLRLPSPALVISCLALLIALSGVGYAAKALPRNSVGTAQLKANAVNGSKVAKDSLTGADIKESTLVPAQNVAVRVESNNPQAIQSDTLTPVTFASEAFDQGGFFNPASPTLLTIPKSGLYEIYGSVRWSGGVAPGTREMLIQRNGGGFIASDFGEDSSISENQRATVLQRLTKGDTIRLVVSQTTGEQGNLSGCDHMCTALSALWLGP